MLLSKARIEIWVNLGETISFVSSLIPKHSVGLSPFFAAQTESPFYEEWWFLLVLALCGLVLILLVVFALILHSQTKKYRNCNPGETASLRVWAIWGWINAKIRM